MIAARPLYQQIKDRIVEQIATGQWPPGKKIPSENDLVRELGVSRMTVHRALRELAQDGRLQRVAGVGTFVAEPPRHASLMELCDIAEEIRDAGAEHHAKLLGQKKVRLDATLAERMELPVGHEVDYVALVHYRDDLPIQHEERWVDPRVVPDFADLDVTASTPSEHLLNAIPADEVEHFVRAELASPTICRALAITPNEPCLRLERRTWNSGRLVTYAILTYPGSRYDLGGRYRPGASGSRLNPTKGQTS